MVSSINGLLLDSEGGGGQRRRRRNIFVISNAVGLILVYSSGAPLLFPYFLEASCCVLQAVVLDLRVGGEELRGVIAMTLDIIVIVDTLPPFLRMLLFSNHHPYALILLSSSPCSPLICPTSSSLGHLLRRH